MDEECGVPNLDRKLKEGRHRIHLISHSKIRESRAAEAQKKQEAVEAKAMKEEQEEVDRWLIRMEKEEKRAQKMRDQIDREMVAVVQAKGGGGEQAEEEGGEGGEEERGSGGEGEEHKGGRQAGKKVSDLCVQCRKWRGSSARNATAICARPARRPAWKFTKNIAQTVHE
jgi:hypothetical protein